LIVSFDAEAFPEAGDAAKKADRRSEKKSRISHTELYFDDIQGGFTLTNSLRCLKPFRFYPSSFTRCMRMGAPDELVRGGGHCRDAAPRRLTRHPDDGPTSSNVFNGVCVERKSGQVPVPRLHQRCSSRRWKCRKNGRHSHDRPPILPAPGFLRNAAPAKERARPRPAVKAMRNLSHIGVFIACGGLLLLGVAPPARFHPRKVLQTFAGKQLPFRRQ